MFYRSNVYAICIQLLFVAVLFGKDTVDVILGCEIVKRLCLLKRG